jgi:peptidoglycan hydrolase-like protein with peptidoglycan-binding domain
LKSANNEEKPKEIATNNVAQKDVDKNTILSVQKILVKFGYKLGNPDGVMGKQTVKAIKEYQK